LAGSPAQIGKTPKVKVPKIKKVRKVKVAKPTTGFGRGWHLKKKFVSPDGKVYSFGKLTKKSSK